MCRGRGALSYGCVEAGEHYLMDVQRQGSIILWMCRGRGALSYGCAEAGEHYLMDV